MKRLLVSLLALLSTFITADLYAYNHNRPQIVTITLGEGYEFFSSTRNLQNTNIPNLELAYNFNEKLAFEFLFGRILTELKGSKQDVRGYLYLLDGLYRFHPCHLFQPYLLAGLGVTSLKPNGNDAVNQVGFNAGVGTQFFIDKSIAFRLDIRDIYTFVGGKNDVLLNAGISFLIAGVN